MIPRPIYTKQLTNFINKPQIKIITGIRRSGKSTVLRLLKEELLHTGVKEEQVILMNFESFSFAEYTTAKKLYEYIKLKIQPAQKNYLLLDEIQEVEGWEKAVNSLMVDFDTDIYITGSNSHLLSSELATYLAGRYVEIPVFTLSFREYLNFKKHYSPEEEDAGQGFCRLLAYGRLSGYS